MDSPCIKQTVCKVLKIFQYGKHLVANVLKEQFKLYQIRDVYTLLTRRLTCNGWLVGFVALRPKSTAMVIAGRSVHLTTLFPGQA